MDGPRRDKSNSAVLNMRNYGATVMYSRDPVTFDEDFNREIGRYVVTEQIYIHSKLLIVDDAVAIVGTANINDRSLTGNGDTEIAAVVVDTEGVELRDLGSPTVKVQTRKFARELRQQLWKKHFGFMVDSTEKESSYFRSTIRASRAKATIPMQIAHPPRLVMNAEKIEKCGGVEWQEMLNRPCAPATVKAIQTIAKHNARIYEEVFQHTPRESMTTFDDIIDLKFHSIPYPPSYGRHGDFVLRMATSDNNRHTGGLGNRSTHAAQLAELADEQRRKEGFKGPVGDVRKLAGQSFGGVVPPSLQKGFMTDQLQPHQKSALNEMKYTRRQQLFSDCTVHDVDAAIAHLKKHVVGFFMAAPLDWGKDHKIVGDPSKATVGRVDISAVMPATDENRRSA